MADPRQGGIALGQLLFGQADPKAGLAEQGQVYKNTSALEQARIDRAKRMAYEALPDAIRDDPELGKRAVLNQAMATINPNLSILAEGNMKLGDLAIAGQRSDAMDAGETPRYNQLTALQTDKPYQPIRVVGGNMMADGVQLGDESVVPLPQTLANIERSEALTNQGQQRTNAAVDKKRHGSQGGNKPTTASEEAEVLRQARERIKTPEDAKRVAEYLRAKGYPGVAKKIYSGK